MPGDKMLTDLLLAILHHLLMFMLFAALVGEFVLMRQGISARDLRILAHIDRMYGVLALAIIAVGTGRVFFGLKGWEYYAGNHAFWGKMLAFLAVALLSIRPTIRIARWRKMDAAASVLDAEIRATRPLLVAQLVAFALIPIFAALMARMG